MIHKSSFLLLAALLPSLAQAELSVVSIIDASSSGRVVRINLDASAGLEEGEPVLFRADGQRVASGRVIRLESGSAVIGIAETYGGKQLTKDGAWELLHGEPFDEAPNLPDYVADREDETPNPANERFFTPDGREIESTPELDDENYTPEITLRPKFPEPKLYSPHNITVGVALFRNRTLPTGQNPSSDPNQANFTTYQGYTLRYAYTFRTSYWLSGRTQALISAEASWGSYSFNHTFPAGNVAQVRVMPLGFNLRYQIEMSRLFRLYPYIGYQNNIVSATNGSAGDLRGIKGGRLLGGAGAQLIMSDNIDSRLEGGSDGVMFGLVVKF